MVPHVLRADKNSATIGQRDGKFGAGGSQPGHSPVVSPAKAKARDARNLNEE